ncbi:DUF6538 domain-containing protein [Aquabacterium sp. OR-4]|uniref:DUF6538 domain-containing protein n=1 Tax=Aquabacterium sp. OR-4 TaxID=2978127 RepID=UPI0021B41AA1|nr:site-specific integrase [Aquabacterium sp. OR-4]MDT7834786.1 site-specific integrase [Aquabacterium sp. OR-4]
MSQRHHLRRRSSGVYAVRFVVPERLRVIVGCSEVQRSTGCRDLVVAKIVAAEMAAHWHRTIASLMTMDPQKVLQGSVDLLGDGTLPLAEAAKLLGADLMDLTRRLAHRHARFLVEANTWSGWVLDDITELNHERDESGYLVSVDISDGALQRLGQERVVSRQLELYLPSDAVRVVQAAAGAAVALFRFSATGLSRVGFVVPYPGVSLVVDHLLVRRLDVEALRRSLSPQLRQVDPGAPGHASPVSPAHESGLAIPRHAKKRLSELATLYLDKRAGHWKPDELRRQRDACGALVAFTGDALLGEVDREMLWSVSGQLRRLPHRRHLVSAPKLSNGATDWHELVRLAGELRMRTATAGSVERLVEDMSSIIAFGVKLGWLMQNPAAELAAEVFESMGGTRRQSHQQREQFSDDDLGKIFGVEWFVTGVGRRTQQGIFHSYRPHYYWLPVLALFTGGRINELSQLYLDDIKELEPGLWVIDFNLANPDKQNSDDDDIAPDKSLKTVAAERQVPIHSKLLELRLLDYVAALRIAGHQRLFPELIHHPDKGYGKAASSWFNERFLGKRLKLPRDGRKVFHSFRHTVNTALERAGVPDKAFKQLLGHSLKAHAGASAHYIKAREAAELRPHIEALQFDNVKPARFDVAAGVEAVGHALRLKESHQRPH